VTALAGEIETRRPALRIHSHYRKGVQRMSEESTEAVEPVVEPVTTYSDDFESHHSQVVTKVIGAHAEPDVAPVTVAEVA
jgi:hypothetical protein